MIINPKEARTFGQISALYEEARPNYPPALIDDIIAFSRIPSGGKVLDIGCGSGQVTFPFAQRGYPVIGLDVSVEMIDIAKHKCSSFPQVSFMVGPFEEVDIEDHSLDLITSGMAWHWVTSKDRYQKAARLLNEKGAIALFWQYQPREESELVTQMGKILDRWGGPNRGPAGGRVNEIAHEVMAELHTSSEFSNVELREYNEKLQFTQQQYRNLVFSYGWVQGLNAENQRGLENDLNVLLTQQQEPLVIPYKHVLVMAKKN
ncbi:class I SAM-dependent methyltransferase [Candidatus Woesearchaeota archaeon]|nr:class I SAM-dependent methyltransferase [Candidatus Woesearchaeota archaeon]